jgi:hypothetical protein
MKKVIFVLLTLNALTLIIWVGVRLKKKSEVDKTNKKLKSLTDNALIFDAKRKNISQDENYRLRDISNLCSSGGSPNENDTKWFISYCRNRMLDKIQGNEVNIVLLSPVLDSWKSQNSSVKLEIEDFCKKMAYEGEGYGYKSLGVCQVALMQLPDSKKILEECAQKSDSVEAKQSAKMWLDVYNGKTKDDRVKIK